MRRPSSEFLSEILVVITSGLGSNVRQDRGLVKPRLLVSKLSRRELQIGEVPSRRCKLLCRLARNKVVRENLVNFVWLLFSRNELARKLSGQHALLLLHDQVLLLVLDSSLVHKLLGLFEYGWLRVAFSCLADDFVYLGP